MTTSTQDRNLTPRDKMDLKKEFVLQQTESVTHAFAQITDSSNLWAGFEPATTRS